VSRSLRASTPAVSRLVHVSDVAPLYRTEVTEPPVDRHVYLDTDVIIDYRAVESIMAKAE
jgi:hypothetical protein